MALLGVALTFLLKLVKRLQRVNRSTVVRPTASTMYALIRWYRSVDAIMASLLSRLRYEFNVGHHALPCL